MWYNPATWRWPSFNGTADNSIPEEFITINGQPVIGSFDIFDLGTEKQMFFKDSEKFVRLYERNFVLNTVIGKIAKAASNANFTGIDGKESQLLDKVNSPNSFQSKEEFIKEFVVYTLSSGYSIIWKRWGAYGFIDTFELININPDEADIRKNSIAFEFEGQSYSVDKKDFIIFYDIKKDRSNDKGYSRIKPLKSQVRNIESAQIAKGIQINNSGVAIVSPKATTGNTAIDEGLNAPQIEIPTLPGSEPVKTKKTDLEEKLNTRGIQNRVIVSDKGVDINNLSQALSGLKFDEIVEPDALAIYDAFGFPVELSPYGKSATFENKATAEASLYDNEVIPLINSLTKSLNTDDVLSKFGQINADFNHVAAIAAKNDKQNETNKTIVETYALLADKQFISAQEGRKMLIDKGILNL